MREGWGGAKAGLWTGSRWAAAEVDGTKRQAAQGYLDHQLPKA